MSSPELDHRSRRSSSIKGDRSYRKSYDAYSTNSRGDYGRDFSEKCQVRATGFPAEVSDNEIKDVVIHEMEKFGDVLNIQLQGHDHNRQAHVLFRDDDAARELRRYCLERHCKVIAFQRALHFDFDLNTRKTSSYRSSYSQSNTYKPAYRNNDKYDRNDFNDRSYTNSRDRYNNDNHINPRATRTLFVGNLDQGITKDELMRIFEHWGAIDDIDVKRPPNGIPAYAFIKYLELEAAASAKNQMFGKEINGRLIKVGYGKTQPSTRLWIGGLGHWCSSDLLNREFDRFGALRKIEYVKGSRHAFVEFESIDAASAAHTEMRGFPLGGPDRKIKIDYAEPDSNCHSSDDHDRTFDSHDSYRNRSDKYYSEQNNGRKYERHRRTSENDGRRRTRSRSPIENDRHNYKERNKKSSPALLPVHNNKSTDSKSSNGHNYTKVEEINIENLSDVSKRFAVVWRGAFALKNSAFPVKMHLIGGNPELANYYLRGIGAGAGPAFKVLNVTQRLRLDQSKLDEVARRVQHAGSNGHCILLALANGDDVELEDSYQRRPLKSLVTYFRKKEAAGVIILSTEGPSGKQEETGMLHAFPPCAFSHQYLLRTAPNIGPTPSKEDHLIVIIVKGNS
ncbi:RNA-binding protein spenito [Hydra vulgaris]|uniref:RNA-binding protein spenito n=1 Tax=Hydra vulgaris TaxID=6087 RepID=A0ABM4D723_HYDVU